MLVEYQGKRFRVSDRTYEFFKRDYPDKAKKLKKIKESEEYYNYDKLNKLIEPDTNKTKETIIKNYIYSTEKYDEYSLNGNTHDMQKYFGAKEMVRKIGIELIDYDPEKNTEEVSEIRKELEQKQEEYQNWLKNFRESNFVGGK